jgi:hypothetical protein
VETGRSEFPSEVGRRRDGNSPFDRVRASGLRPRRIAATYSIAISCQLSVSQFDLGDDVLCVFCSSSFPNNGSRRESTTSPSLILPSSSPVEIKCQLGSYTYRYVSPHHYSTSDIQVPSPEGRIKHIPLTTPSTISPLLSPSGANKYAVAVSLSSILNVGGGDKQKRQLQ